MKRILFLLILYIPLGIWAQTDSKYLEGAISMRDGKITFTTEMNAPGMTQQQIYNAIYNWAKNRYQPDGKLNARILYEKPEKGNFIAGGEEYITFSSTALSLDRTRIYYLMNIVCEAEKCNIDITRIHYWYDEARKGGQKYTAEEWITDEMALNKSKNKLSPITGKFRKGTIDLKDLLFSEIQSALNKEMVSLGLSITTTSSHQKEVAQTQSSTSPITTSTEKKKSVDTLIKDAVRLTITTGNEEQFEIPLEAWGGINDLYGKKVACCIIDSQKTMGNMLMSQNDLYTLSFYSANNQEPILIIQCKKLMQQNISGEEAQKINSSCSAEKSYNMYIGEIQK